MTTDRFAIDLGELQNAATAPVWTDDDGVVHEPIGETGVEAVRGMFLDRRVGTHAIPANVTRPTCA